MWRKSAPFCPQRCGEVAAPTGRIIGRLVADAFLVIVSRRETRAYRPDPLPDEVVRRILEAGRISGSGANRQPWRFVVVRARALLDRLAPTLYAPGNARAPLLVAVLLEGQRRSPFDGGRAAQNMMLAAWNDGVGACPNGFADEQAARDLLGVRADQELLVAVTFGYPVSRRRPESRSADEWLARARRLPLDELVQAWL
jgi:nitroreductase